MPKKEHTNNDKLKDYVDQYVRDSRGMSWK